jgi:hypothetical protein
MSTVASVDYIAKRIYLSADTVGVPLDTTDVYRDVRALRRLTEAHRKFKPMIVGGGNIQKTATSFTQPYVVLLYGCSLVPYNTAQSLVVIRDTFADDGRAGVACFDRSTVTAEVDIDIQVAPVEVREVVTGGGGGSSLTAAQVWNYILDNGQTAAELMRLRASIDAGLTTVVDLGGGNATVTFRDLADTKDRVTAEMTGSERTSVTLDLD